MTHQQDRLPGHPAYRQQRLAFDPVVVVGVKVPAHAEVWDFDDVSRPDKAIPGGREEMMLLGGGKIARNVDTFMYFISFIKVGIHNDGQAWGGYLLQILF